jgi:hypothetical protein
MAVRLSLLLPLLRLDARMKGSITEQTARYVLAGVLWHMPRRAISSSNRHQPVCCLQDTLAHWQSTAWTPDGLIGGVFAV